MTNSLPSLSEVITQSIPLTWMHLVEGPGELTPQRATIAGSPQARTVGEEVVTDRTAWLATVDGHVESARAHSGFEA